MVSKISHRQIGHCKINSTGSPPSSLSMPAGGDAAFLARLAVFVLTTEDPVLVDKAHHADLFSGLGNSLQCLSFCRLQFLLRKTDTWLINNSSRSPSCSRSLICLSHDSFHLRLRIHDKFLLALFSLCFFPVPSTS